VAQSLDGRITGGPERWISSAESRKIVHEWRGSHDCILVGANTVRIDNPELSTRLAKGRDPAVVVLDGRLTLSGKEKLFRSSNERRVFIATTREAVRRQSVRVRQFAHSGVDVVAFDVRGSSVPHGPLLTMLHDAGISSVLVEGGAGVFSAFASHGLIDELSLFLRPGLFGRGLSAFGHEHQLMKSSEVAFSTVWSEVSGKDLLLRAYAEAHPESVRKIAEVFH
jgi:diaminohydroxyphosphoribosylaminopyrimidine deaminase/5-amino-6-(5-phosphoribosylamino)uracil reductase